jgi:hypothetical protein
MCAAMIPDCSARAGFHIVRGIALDFSNDW